MDYLVDEGLATAMFLSLALPQPLLLEGEAGVGKTEAAKALAAVLDTPLVRLQCYEGIDASEALYEWNYPRQLLSIRLADARGAELREADLFGPDYLIARPLLRALQHPGPRPAVLLIDEIDRADDDFEAFLLELLAEATVTIPEIGTVRATHPPAIVLTSNRTRDLHDAVKRRCLYQWIDYPNPAREVEIIRRRVKGAAETLAVQVADAVSRMRESDVQKPPGIAEAIDWLAALELLGVAELDEAAAQRTLGPCSSTPRTRTSCVPPGWPAGRRGPVTRMPAFGVETVELDLPALAVTFARRLHDAGVPVSAERCARFAAALKAGRARGPAPAVLDRPGRVRVRPVPAARPSMRCSPTSSAPAPRRRHDHRRPSTPVRSPPSPTTAPLATPTPTSRCWPGVGAAPAARPPGHHARA